MEREVGEAGRCYRVKEDSSSKESTVLDDDDDDDRNDNAVAGGDEHELDRFEESDDRRSDRTTTPYREHEGTCINAAKKKGGLEKRKVAKKRADSMVYIRMMPAKCQGQAWGLSEARKAVRGSTNQWLKEERLAGLTLELCYTSSLNGLWLLESRPKLITAMGPLT
ncbi:uncharacterized protein A4U43_C04F18390 [Asparagus officinalis]|uniref:Uncharacterized protein n=1 Tax=Asparagus officinalis TaxID=4686 RepID=A0A5P1F767_ASPOF|nr:uncharacterized protein A4U43_C04F18390 [Asparagus officinalis]